MNTLYENIKSLQSMLIARATGETPDEESYVKLRAAVLAEPLVRQVLPEFVRTNRSLGQFWQYIKSKHDKYHDRRAFLYEQFEPALALVEIASRSPGDEAVSATLDKIDSDYIQSAWSKALSRRATDPEGAITSARTLLESICKHILDDCGVSYGEAPDITKLYKLAAEQLNLAPSQHSETIFKQILGGCAAVVEGLSALRNRLSDAHGTGKLAARPAARHAELAVNLSGAVSSYLWATWEEKQKRE